MVLFGTEISLRMAMLSENSDHMFTVTPFNSNVVMIGSSGSLVGRRLGHPCLMHLQTLVTKCSISACIWSQENLCLTRCKTQSAPRCPISSCNSLRTKPCYFVGRISWFYGPLSFE